MPHKCHRCGPLATRSALPLSNNMCTGLRCIQAQCQPQFVHFLYVHSAAVKQMEQDACL